MTGVLGVPTMQYLPFAFFNLLNPLVALVYAFTGFRIEHVDRPPTRPRTPAATQPPAASPTTEGDAHVD